MLVFNYSRCNAENKRQHRPTSQEKQSLITGMVNNLKYFSVELWWSLYLTLSGPRLFRYRKDQGGGGGFHPPPPGLAPGTEKGGGPGGVIRFL